VRISGESKACLLLDVRGQVEPACGLELWNAHVRADISDVLFVDPGNAIEEAVPVVVNPNQVDVAAGWILNPQVVEAPVTVVVGQLGARANPRVWVLSTVSLAFMRPTLRRNRRQFANVAAGEERLAP